MSDATTDAILDAMRATVLDFGIQRTTLTDVARRAGLSRMTIYRRYPDVDGVLRDLMTREFSAMLHRVEHAKVDLPRGRARVVARLMMSVRELRANPLLAKILEVEPELLQPYLLGRVGGTQRLAISLVARDVAEGQADGSIRGGDPKTMAYMLVLIAQSFAFRRAAEGAPRENLVLTELEPLLDAALAPQGKRHRTKKL
jgi:AcrR family transcriptional regulator